MKSVILVESKTNALENYRDKYKIFIDKQKAVLYAKEQAKKCGFMIFMCDKPEDIKPGYLIFSESGEQYVKVIEIEVEE